LSGTRLRPEQVDRLIEAIRLKIVAKKAMIQEAEGEIVIRAFRKGDGWDVKLRLDT
jgi:hypothetical protein